MAVSIDQQFVEYIVKSLVSNPDAVKVERRIDEKGVLLELTVDGEDLGRVIGKRGATAQSLRTLLRALGTKNDARYNLKIVDTGAPPPPRDRARASDDKAADADNSAEGIADVDDSVEETTLDSLDEAPAEDEAKDRERSSVVDRTRKELAELDDLDV